MAIHLPAEIIKKKRDGRMLEDAEIRFMISGLVRGEIPDYQTSALLMAIYFQGMTAAETGVLMDAMMRSGRVLDFSDLPGVAVDKHSTGGVGDKTSILLAPIVAACGGFVPMIAGRGLGHTGGTLDKLESIPGFRVDLDLDRFQKQVREIGGAIIGQTKEICPADKKIYSLRDVTGTIESLPLICSSIMSKKLAEGIGALVLDVKFGNGAFMKTLADAEVLGKKLVEAGASQGLKVAVLTTDMNQPLGRFIGNAVEIGECFALMKNEPYLGRPVQDFSDTRELTLELAAYMLWLSSRAGSRDEGRHLATEALESGRAWETFERLCAAQEGKPSLLPAPRAKTDILANQDGFVAAFDTEKIGLSSLVLGAGRARTGDSVDPVAGIEVHKKIGDRVFKGEPLFSLLYDPARAQNLQNSQVMIQSACTISLQKPSLPDLLPTKRAPET